MDTAKGGSRDCRAAREDLHRTMRPQGGQKRWSENNRTVGEVAGALRESVQNWRGVPDTLRQCPWHCPKVARYAVPRAAQASPIGCGNDP